METPVKIEHDENLEEPDMKSNNEIPKKQVSRKQYDHLKKAREAKHIKKVEKESNKQMLYQQLTNIYQQLGTMSAQMNNIVKAFPTEENLVNRKRKAEPEVDAIPEKIQKTEPEKEEPEKENPAWEIFNDGVGKLIGASAAFVTLYIYRNYMTRTKNKHPAEYLYRDIQ